jgi:Ca2+-binding EF-hand superfamily protein
MTYLVSQFASSAQKNKLAKIFKEFDKNGDGRLDK